MDRLLAPGHLDCYAARLDVIDATGRARSEFVLAPKGWHADRPATSADLKTKFVSTAGRVVGRPAALGLHADILDWCSGGRAASELLEPINAMVLDRMAYLPETDGSE